MSVLKISERADPNYLATVVKLPKINSHPGADRLSMVEIFGNTIIIAKDLYWEGETVVYFPVECAISKEFLSWANLLDKPELNVDQKTKGFFSSNCRVRAINLRGMPSQGFICKVSQLAKYYEIPENAFGVGDVFDTVGDHVLVTKYVKGTSRTSGEVNSKRSRVPKWIEKTIGFFPKPVQRVAYLSVNRWFDGNREGIRNRIVEGQFKFHYKTEHLGKNLFLLNPDDYITISGKIHGTSTIYSNILCKKPFGLWRLIRNKLGGKIPDEEYVFVYSSRSIVKNRKDGKYTEDVWGEWAEKLNGKIPQGYAVYAEIAGKTSTGKSIQKNYDYSCSEKENRLFVYRITTTYPDGTCIDLSWPEIEKFCSDRNLETVPVYYCGHAKDMFDIPVDENWHGNFLAKLKDTYLDKTCEFCTTGVVREGIVLKINNRVGKPVFKLKSAAFQIKESADRDKGEDDMEEMN